MDLVYSHGLDLCSRLVVKVVVELKGLFNILRYYPSSSWTN
jgi:hypothetical protein